MGKRSNFDRNPRDFYPTPYQAIIPLLPYVSGSFVEPCAGDGRLIRHLSKHGLVCVSAYDIEPDNSNEENLIKIQEIDLTDPNCGFHTFDQIITNPVWERKTLEKMLNLFIKTAPTWLLLKADYAHTKEDGAKKFMKHCSMIVSVGRISWMENGISGKDNCAWYKFETYECPTIFIGRK